MAVSLPAVPRQQCVVRQGTGGEQVPEVAQALLVGFGRVDLHKRLLRLRSAVHMRYAPQDLLSLAGFTFYGKPANRPWREAADDMDQKCRPFRQAIRRFMQNSNCIDRWELNNERSLLNKGFRG